jgi:cardiolipin synthase
LAHNSSLLVDASEFLAAVEPAILGARDRVLVQVMTFEMDQVGANFWDLLVRSPAREKILCVDAFSTAKISDDLVCSPRYLLDRDFRREVAATRRLLRTSQRDGVRIVVTNPMGILWRKFPFRNHKKMMIADNQAFLGGINISEHNFAWRDLMMRTDCAEVVDALAEDFHRTVRGVNISSTYPTALGKLFFLDGRRSRPEYEQVFAVVEGAKRSLDIISPYVSAPLLKRLAGLPPTVRVRVINPALNNKTAMQQELFRAAAGTSFEVLLYQPRMSHMKAILIDDETLILGSSNFDFFGYDLQQEVVLCAKDDGLIRDFRARVLEPVLQQCRPVSSAPSRFYHRGGLGVGLAKAYIGLLSRLPRRT